MSTFWDGLNLAPYEYTASQDSKDPGALVLSEFMGCTRSLSGVIRVNPWGLEQTGEAIHQALSMSAEERQGRVPILLMPLGCRSYVPCHAQPTTRGVTRT
jgi:trehalose-6-phosphate synthase